MNAIHAGWHVRWQEAGAMGVFFFLFFFAFSTVKPLSNILLLGLVLLWAKGWLAAETRRDYVDAIRRSPTVWVLAALSVVVVVHVWGSAGEAEWIERHLRKYARFLYACVLILMLYRRPVWQRCALAGFIGAMALTLVSTWLNVWFRLPWSVSQVPGFGQSHHVFGDYITQNLMMALFVGVCLYLAFDAQAIGRRLAWASTALLAAVSITHLSMGRTGLLVLLAVVATCCAILLPRRWYAMGLGVIGLVILLALTSETMTSRWTMVLQEYSNWRDQTTSAIGHRLYNYETTLALIAERPWWGHGTGAFHTEICRFIQPGTDCAQFNWHPHNQFLLLGADHGLVGMALYALLIGSLYLAAARSADRFARVVLSCLASTLLVNSMINSPLWSSIESQYFAFMIGLLVAMAIGAPGPRRG